MESLHEHIIHEIAVKTNSQIDDIIIEGLKRKGYEFGPNMSIEKFVKQHCKVLVDAKGDRTLLVKDIPFLFLRLNHKVTFDYEPKDKKTTVRCNYAEYSFL